MKNPIIEQAPFCWLIAGTKKCGKTHMISSFLLDSRFGKDFFSFIVLISPSAYSDESWDAVSDYYGDRFRKIHIFTEDNFSNAISFLSVQEGEKFIIVDDCEGVLVKNWNSNSGIIQAFNGIIRKGYISIATIIQNWSNGCHAAIRNQSDIISIFELGTPSQLASLVESLGSSDPKRLVKLIVQALREPFSFITFIKGVGSKKIYYKFSHYIENF